MRSRGEAVAEPSDPLGHLAGLGQTAVDFVCGTDLLAFRTHEATQGADLDGDGDQIDDVIQAWDLDAPACSATSPPPSCLRSAAQAARPCTFEACDPRIPYKATCRTVKFLTFECDQTTGTVNARP